MSAFLAAVAQFPVSRPAAWLDVEVQLTQWVREAVGHGAKLLVFPEYAAMSLAALLEPAEQTDLAAQLRGLQAFRERYVALHSRLAVECGVHILAGSFPWRRDDGRYVNRAMFHAPSGTSGYQDKQVMTRFEREQWGVESGDAMKVFDTSLGCIGVAICYDSEFPLLVRAQVEAGAQILLVPSCTDALAGYNRVRIGCQARALESQCHVLMSPLVGDAPWSASVDVNVGAAGVYGPPDIGFPSDGVIVQGQLNQPGWVYAQIDTGLSDTVRANGQVLNLRHWPEGLVSSAVACVSI